MRRHTLSIAVSSLMLPVLGLAAEVTRTLEVRLSGDPASRFAVENLAGSMRVVAGSGPTVTAVATVHAESEELAQSIRFEQLNDEKGIPTLRVRYPIDRYRSFRYGGSRSQGWFAALFGGESNLKYDGVRVSVSGSRGVGLYADVEVQLPKKAVDGAFRNRVGPIAGQDLEGKLVFDTGSGEVTVSRLRGEIKADTGSGDVSATDIEGSFTCDTGSGSCNVTHFSGQDLKCDTGSGEVNIDQATARRIEADTGSGSIKVRGADTEEFSGDTGSGSIELIATGKRLVRVQADTGSGSVRLRLPAELGFEAMADTGSGDVVSRFSDAEAIVHDHEVVGYRRGDRRIRIKVDTGSGSVYLEPAR